MKSNAVTEYAYHDALGRPVETASSGMDASGRYVHTMQEYDLKGRVSRKWLPAVGGTSAAELGRDAFAGRSSATYGDGYAYSETDARRPPTATATPTRKRRMTAPTAPCPRSSRARSGIRQARASPWSTSTTPPTR